MTQAQFDGYQTAVAYKHAKMAEDLMYKIRSGKHYIELRQDIKKFLLKSDC